MAEAVNLTMEVVLLHQDVQLQAMEPEVVEQLLWEVITAEL